MTVNDPEAARCRGGQPFIAAYIVVMTNPVQTETIVNLRAGSASLAEHPRLAASGPFRVVNSRDVPGVYTGPLVTRALIEPLAAPGEQQWVSLDDLETA